MNRSIRNITKMGIALAFGLCVNSAFAADACSDAMGHNGGGTQVNRNQTGSINGTPWGYELWADGGSNSMTYYSNGTFSAKWSNSNDFLARVGYRYGDNGPGVDHTTKHYTVDYKYTKNGHGSYGYIGVYGWTVNPQVEYYIVDDWYSQPNEQYVGAKFGEITVDGATYTIHAFLRQQEPSKTGTSTFLQIFSIRKQARQCGHIDISAHFNKWDELFTGQQAQLRGSKGGGSATLKFGKVTEVMLMNEAGGNSSGEVDYTYFNMTDDGESSPIEEPDPIDRKPFKGVTATIPGIIEAENFDEGNEGDSYGGTNTPGDAEVDKDYRGKDYYVGIVEGGTGKAVGYTAADEWLEYTVEVAKDGEYDIEANVSNGSGAGKLNLSIDGKSLASLSFTGTENDWNTYELSTGKATLTAGKHTLRITIANANTNVDYVKFTLPGEEIIVNPGPGDDSGTTAIAQLVRMNNIARTVQVFDMQGKFLGKVEIAAGTSVNEAIAAKFQKSGIYMVKDLLGIKKVRVINR